MRAGSDESSQKWLNVATLVGPSSNPDSKTPNLIFSTTKKHPVPFIESYSHTNRHDKELASSPDALPLAQIILPHSSHVPAPRLTPFETVDVSAAVCQDVSYPSLLSSFLSTSSDPVSPQLLLNPSFVPTTSLAESQLIQVRSRAIEQNSFVLRCDGREGISTLIGPEGDLRVWQSNGEEGWTSWEGYVDVERAKGRTWYSRVVGRKSLGSEFAVWLWIALAVGLVGIGESGIVNEERRHKVMRKMDEVARRLFPGRRQRVELSNNEDEEGAVRGGEGGNVEEGQIRRTNEEQEQRLINL